MSDNYIIPISRGLFEHKSRIGPAIWEFLWCIDAVTEEEIGEDGERWGIVLGGAPVKHERIAADIDSSKRTVQRNMSELEKKGYITTVRVSRGEIIKVRKNKKEAKKRYAKNGTSQENDKPKMAHHEERYANNGVSDSSDTPKVETLKDFKDLTITSTPITDHHVIESINLESEEFDADPYLQILNAYCRYHNRFDIHVKPKEREAMGKMVAGGMPVPFTIRTMELLDQEKRRRAEESGQPYKQATSFLYYIDGIWEAWRNLYVQDEIKSDPPNVTKKDKPKSKVQRQMDALEQLLREEQAHEQVGSH